MPPKAPADRPPTSRLPKFELGSSRLLLPHPLPLSSRRPCLSFGGFGVNASPDTGVVVPSDPSLNITEAITIDAWVNPASFPNAFPTLVRKESCEATLPCINQYLLAVTDQGKAHCNINRSLGDLLLGGTVPLNLWTHLACTYDRVTARLYVNGEEVASAPLTEAIASFEQPLGIGVLPGSPSRSFDGLIDEVELFNRALTQAEIRAIFDAGSAGKRKPSGIAPPAGMVSWWPGDGNASDIVDGNHGTLSGGATATADGMVGRAFSFDGTDDFVEVADSPNLRITDVVTIDFWAKRREFAIDIVLEKGGDWNFGETNYGIGLHSVNGNMFYFFFRGGFRGTTGVSDLDWHHYAVVAGHGATDPILYIDGVQLPVEFPGGPAATINLFPSARPLHIGAQTQAGAATHFGNLLLDEIEIFNRALTDAEIMAIFEAGSAGKSKPSGIAPPAGMLSWWAGDGNASDIVDGNHGTIVGGTTFTNGLVAQAFSFDIALDSGITVPNSANLNPTEAITIDARVKPTSFPQRFPNGCA